MKKWSFLIWFLSFSSMLFAQNPQWLEFQTPVKASLRGLSPVSDQVCWASGSGGKFLLTMDGGNTWKSGTIGGLDTVDFRSIHALSEDVAVAASAGQPAVIYRTEDGGDSWKKVHQEGEAAFFDAIFFVNPTNGYLLGDPVDGKWMILETVDGGKSWHALSKLPSAMEGEAAFAASSSSLIADAQTVSFATGGSVARLHQFSLSSNTWIVKNLSAIAQSDPAKGVFAMTKVDGKMVLVGGDYTQLDNREGNSLLIGEYSDRVPKEVPHGYRSGIAYLERNGILVAVGPSGSDFSKDSGNSWTKFSTTGYHAVKVSNDGKSIWASGSQGRIGKILE